jgi:hypothetical protein
MANTKIPVELSSTPGIVDNSNATAITIDSSENVGIGTTSPSDYYSVPLVVATSGDQGGITIANTTANKQGMLAFADGTSGSDRYSGYIDYNHNTNVMSFGTNGGSERMRIDGYGNIGIGLTNPSDYYAKNLVVSGTNEGGITIASTGNHTNYLLFADSTSGVARYAGMIGYSHNTDLMEFRTNSIQRMAIDSSGNVGIGAAPVAAEGVFLQTGNNTISQRGFSTNIYYDGSNYRAINTGGSTLIQGGDNHIFYTAASASAGATQTPVERMRIDSSGRLLVGLTGASGFGTLETTSFASDGSCYLARSSGNVLVGTTNNSMSLKVCVNGSFGSVTSGNGNRNFIVNTVSNENWNAAGTVVYCGKNGTTSRSINAGGTINASGADYAEYMKKADTCGTIAKGDVCGVDSTGKLTDVFADSLSFVIKSTNPSYVGGDTWGDVDLGLTEEQTETERQKYDRIAFSGQVPVNITGSFNVGDYVYPQANGTDIECVAKSSPTFEEYQICVGKIWATEDDGRPLVAVKIG